MKNFEKISKFEVMTIKSLKKVTGGYILNYTSTKDRVTINGEIVLVDDKDGL